MMLARFVAASVTLASIAALGLLRERQTRTWGTVTSLPRGGRVGRIERCARHGISYDADKEVCPACAAER